MKTLILPGFSLPNKDWAEAMARKIPGSEVVYWPHWQSGTAETDWIRKEAVKIGLANKTPINILSKSIGTVVAGQLWELNPAMVNKMILCGLPIADLGENYADLYRWLKDLPAEKVRCVQNENDNHGSFEAVEKMIREINPGIRVESRPREDHEYYYPEEFKSFFESQ